MYPALADRMRPLGMERKNREFLKLCVVDPQN